MPRHEKFRSKDRSLTPKEKPLSPHFSERYKYPVLSLLSFELLGREARRQNVDVSTFVWKWQVVHAIVEVYLRNGHGTVDSARVYKPNHPIWKSNSFLRLPAEIRNRIFEYTLVSHEESLTFCFTPRSEGYQIQYPSHEARVPFVPQELSLPFRPNPRLQDYEEVEPTVNYRSRACVNALVGFSRMNRQLRAEASSFFWANNTFEFRPFAVDKWPRIWRFQGIDLLHRYGDTLRPFWEGITWGLERADNSTHVDCPIHHIYTSHFPAYTTFFEFIWKHAGSGTRALQLMDRRFVPFPTRAIMIRGHRKVDISRLQLDLAGSPPFPSPFSTEFYSRLADFTNLEYLSMAIHPYQVLVSDFDAMYRFYGGSAPLPRAAIMEFAAQLTILPGLKCLELHYDEGIAIDPRCEQFPNNSGSFSAGKTREIMNCLEEELKTRHAAMYSKTIHISVRPWQHFMAPTGIIERNYYELWKAQKPYPL